MHETVSSQPATRASSGFWKSVREAIAGSHQDFTEGSIPRAIALLAIPMVLEMMMESLFGIVDIFFVAKLGRDSIASVALTESMLTLIFGVAMGLSMATTAMVARRIGEKDAEGAAVAAVQSIAMGLLFSAGIGIAGAWNAPGLLALMGGDAGVVRAGSRYTSVLLGGTGSIFMLFLINGIFRGAGDAAIAMRTLWLANCINIVLDPCLINGWGPFPRLGVTGAAIATTTGRSIGVIYQLWRLMGAGGRVKIRRVHLRTNVQVLMRLLRVSVSGVIQFLIATASWMGMVRIMATFGSAALAGYTVAIKIIIFAILPSWGMSNAAATLVGQNLGAGKPERAERSVWLTGFYNMLFLACVGVVFIAFAERLVGLFTSDPGIAAVATTCLRYVSYGYVFYAWGMVVVQAFNGAGDTFTPTVINLFCYWLWQIPLAYVLATKANLGPSGVFMAITIAESTLAVVGVIMFRRGSWKKQKI
jgi:MATE family, multidrug efflux pump